MPSFDRIRYRRNDASVFLYAFDLIELNGDDLRRPRKGRYSVTKLIEKYGRKGNLMKWKDQLNGDCPKRDAHSLHERCDLICPDLPKVL